MRGSRRLGARGGAGRRRHHSGDSTRHPARSPAAPQGPLAGRPAGPGGDRARPQPGLEARRRTSRRRPRTASSRATPAGWPATASTAPGSARCGPASRPTSPASRTRSYLRTVAAGARPARRGSRSGCSSTSTRTSGTRRTAGRACPTGRCSDRRRTHALPPVVAPFPTGYWTPEVSTVFDNFWADQDDLLDGWAAAWRIARGALAGPALPDGLRPAQRAVDGPRVDDLPGRRLPRVVRRGAAAGDGAWPAARSARSTTTTSSGGSRSSSPAASRSTRSTSGAGGGPARAARGTTTAPTVFLESPGRARRRRRELLGASTATASAHALEPGARDAAPCRLMSEWGATDNIRAIDIDAAVGRRAPDGLDALGLQASGTTRPPPTTRRACSATTRDLALGQARQAAPAGAHLRPGHRRHAADDATSTPGTGAFRFRYRPDRRIAAPTRIFVSPLHYPHGYGVDVDGGRVVHRDERAPQRAGRHRAGR